MTNLEIFEFKKTLQHYIGANEMPEEVKRYVLKDLLEEQESLVYDHLQKEIEEREKTEKEETEHAESSC